MSHFAPEIENSVSSWLLRPDVNGDFSGRDIRSDLDILDGTRPEEQAFHVTEKSKSSIKCWPEHRTKVEITRGKDSIKKPEGVYNMIHMR